MKNKPTQSQAILDHMKDGSEMTASICYRVTKQKTGIGSVNLHVLLRELGKRGVKFQSQWVTTVRKPVVRYKRHWIDFKKTPKKALK